MIPERLPSSVAGLDQMCQYIKASLGNKYVPIKLDDGCEITAQRLINVVEVGAWTGAGTKVFARFFAKVYAVDPWSSSEPEIAGEYDMKRVEAIFDGRFIGNGRVVKIKKRSLDAVRDFDDASVDVVYIDAIHKYEYVRDDIKAWLPKVRPGGFISGHDYERRFAGVKRAVDEAFGGGSGVIYFPDSSWAVRIK